MRFISFIPFLLSITILLMLPITALAMPAITCHCFTERSYDAARPAAADPYFLATTQNSFFAAVFNIDKKTIVIKKQQGTSPDDLWIAYWVSSKSGDSADSLLQGKMKNATWKDALAPLRLTAKNLGSRFSIALNGGASSAKLSEAVVDDLFIGRHLLGDSELTAIRRLGASNQELIIATFIAAKTRQPARQICLEAKNSTKTWGTLLLAAKVDTKNMQQEITSVLKLQ